ncbi:MAG: hypothetical protein H7Z16_19585 [Pyrinomonadaceae bacterium]|nr:hypothetical protein [Pyrinomonadaceae bacterium]
MENIEGVAVVAKTRQGLPINKRVKVYSKKPIYVRHVGSFYEAGTAGLYTL